MKPLAAILLIVASTSVHAQKVTGAEIVQYGVLKKIKSAGLVDAPNSLSGKINNVLAGQLVQSTTTIQATVGTTWLSVGIVGAFTQSSLIQPQVTVARLMIGRVRVQSALRAT